MQKVSTQGRLETSKLKKLLKIIYFMNTAEINTNSIQNIVSKLYRTTTQTK